MAADSINVKVQGVDMKFAVDSKTTVEARGAGTKSRAAQRAGAAGPKLSEVVKVGGAVGVSYHGAGATMHAAKNRARPDPGPAPPASAPRETSRGTGKAGNPEADSIR